MSDLTILQFTASRCGPCKVVTPILEKLCASLGIHRNVVDIDSEQGSKLTEEYGVKSVPTLLLIKGDQVVARRVGVSSLTSLTAWVEENRGA